VKLADFLKVIAAYGCTADINRIRWHYDVVIESPNVFRGTGTHCLVHHTLTADCAGEMARVRKEAYEDMLEQLPLVSCTDPACDICLDAKEDAEKTRNELLK